MSSQIFVRLKILSNTLDPEEISSIIGLSADRVWRVGDKRKNTIIVEKNNGWILDSRLPSESDLDIHIRSLLNLLEPYSSKIKSISDSNEIEFSCVVYSENVPSLYFDKEIVSAVSRLGASLDIDYYPLNP